MLLVLMLLTLISFFEIANSNINNINISSINNLNIDKINIENTHTKVNTIAHIINKRVSRCTCILSILTILVIGIMIIPIV